MQNYRKNAKLQNNSSYFFTFLPFSLSSFPFYLFIFRFPQVLVF